MDKLKELWARIVAWFTGAKAKVKEEADEFGDKLEDKKDELEEKWKAYRREEEADHKLEEAKDDLHDEVKDGDPVDVQIAELRFEDANVEHDAARDEKQRVKDVYKKN